MSDLPENVYDRVERLCDQWERVAAEPGVSRCPPLPPDARHLLRQLARRIVLDAAGLCDLRARPEDKSMSVRNEATKCGSAVRHFLLCRDGEHVCYHCDGAGCRHCRMAGVVRYPGEG